MDDFKTLVVPDAHVDLARQLCALEAGGAGMFTTGLSATGQEPATHYISSGFCPPLITQYTPTQVWEMQDDAWVLVDTIPGNPVAVYDASQAAEPPVQCTLADIETLFADSDITQQEPFVAMGRMGLQIVQPEPDPIPDPAP